ncbi:MAG: 6-bladed beta-propeller [Saprospiraceae bacterium]|nr:6-bladed beta-propeller [Saprospiraceae bacterium]
MDRRTFLQQGSLALATFPLLSSNTSEPENPVFGHNDKRYTWQKNWPVSSQSLPQVRDCHEMVFTEKKEIVLLTNDTRNNVLFFQKDGRFLRSWGSEFPGGHGLTLAGSGKDAFFLITDTERHQVFQTTLDGRHIRHWECPLESGKYNDCSQFVPTETAVADNGDFYVADGYGLQYILHYGADGTLKNIFGGRGEGEASLDNAHGICVDKRQGTPTLLVTDRNRCCFKRFSLDGMYLETISLPGANVCRPVISGDFLYAAVLTSGNTGNANSGFVIILDQKNEPVSLIAGATPMKKDGQWLPMYQTVDLFRHPHDVLVDDDQNLYVCQWNSRQVLPYKFIPYGA